MHERSSKNSMKKFVSIALLLLKGKKKNLNHLKTIFHQFTMQRLMIVYV